MNEPFSVFSSSSCFRLSLCPLADRSPRLLRPREPRTEQLLRPAAQHPPPPRPIQIPVAPTAQHHNSQPPPHYHSPLQYAQLFMRANPNAASVRTIRYSSIECRLACRVGCRAPHVPSAGYRYRTCMGCLRLLSRCDWMNDSAKMFPSLMRKMSFSCFETARINARMLSMYYTMHIHIHKCIHTHTQNPAYDAPPAWGPTRCVWWRRGSG